MPSLGPNLPLARHLRFGQCYETLAAVFGNLFTKHAYGCDFFWDHPLKKNKRKEKEIILLGQGVLDMGKAQKAFVGCPKKKATHVELWPCPAIG